MDRALHAFTGRISDGDIRLLRVFTAVVQRGGFAAAESELQIGLPSISRCIKDLETRLGMRLCRRGRVGFALTEQGERVYAASLRFLEQIRAFESEIRLAHSELVGTLEVGLVDSLITDPQFNLAELLARLKDRHPAVAINVTVRTSNLVEQLLLEGKLHVGVIFGRRRISQLDYTHLYQEDSNLYCDASHPLAASADRIAPEEVSNHDFVGYGFAEDIDRMNTKGLKGVLRPTASVDHMEAVATLVATGRFIGFLPGHYVRSVWRCAGFCRILPETFAYSTDVELVARQGMSSALAHAFLKLAAERAPVAAPPGEPVRALAADQA